MAIQKFRFSRLKTDFQDNIKIILGVWRSREFRLNTSRVLFLYILIIYLVQVYQSNAFLLYYFCTRFVNFCRFPGQNSAKVLRSIMARPNARQEMDHFLVSTSSIDCSRCINQFRANWSLYSTRQQHFYCYNGTRLLSLSLRI